MMLLRCPQTGDQTLAESAEGYPGWQLVADNVPPPIDQYYVWSDHDQRWKADQERRLRDENMAAMRDPEVLLAIIDDLHAQIAALKGEAA